MYSIGKVFLPFVTILSIVCPAVSKADNHFKTGLFSRFHVNSTVNQKPNSLSKKTASQWKQTGAIDYYNNGSSLKDTAWEFSSRDTIIYDVNGNEVLRKTSDAESGWGNLESIDSTIYQNGKIIEQVSKVNSGNGSALGGGSRYTYAYLDGGKTLLEIDYLWNDSLSKWAPENKDSIIFSTPISIDPVNFLNDVSGILKQYTFSYEGTGWTSTGYMARNDSESDSKTLVMDGKDLQSNDSADDSKMILVFNSTAWLEDNLVEMKSQSKNPVDGKYYDDSKTEYTANSESDYEYDWDSVSNTPYCTSKSFTFYDSHKNDTLDIDCEFNTDSQSWDTSSISIYSRIYDNNSNNIITIESDYDSNDDSWSYTKEINSFAQINVPVIHFFKAVSKQNISILQTAGSFRFCAPGITGLDVYDIQGRMIASIKQNAASSITLNLSEPYAKISSGSYIAKLICKDDVKSFPLIMR